jgi:hypothetical protein
VLADHHVEVFHSRELLGQRREFVIVGGEHCAAADVVVNVLDHAPGERKSVVGARAAADFVEHHQAAARRCVENPRRLGHLDHEGALAARELVARPHPGKEPIGDADGRPSRRDKAADLRQQHQEHRLADVGTLARHVGAGDEEHARGGFAVAIRPG